MSALTSMLYIMPSSTQPYQCMTTIQSPTIDHLPANLDGHCSLHLNQMRVIIMDILHVVQRLRTTDPTTAFFIPSDSRVRSSRSSSACSTRLGRDRDDRYSRSDANSLSSLDWHVMSMGETCWNYAYSMNISMPSLNSDGSSMSLSALHKGVNTSSHSCLTFCLRICSFLVFFLLVFDSTWLFNARLL